MNAVLKRGSSIMVIALIFLTFPRIAPADVFLPFSESFDCSGSVGVDQPNICSGWTGLSSRGCGCASGNSSITSNSSFLGGSGNGFRQSEDATDCSSPGLYYWEMFKTSPKKELWFRWYARYPASYVAPYYKKIWYIGPNVIGWNYEYFGLVAQGVSGSPLYGSSVTFSDVMGGNQGDNQWHCYEFHIKVDTNTHDGVLDMWVDGVNYMHETNLDFSSADPSVRDGIVSPMFLSNGDGQTACTYGDYDEIVITDAAHAPAGGWRYDAQGRPMIGMISTTPDTEAPTVPGSLAATAFSSSQINLSWSASTDNVGVSGYKIYRNGVLIFTTPDTAYQDHGLSASTTYTYRVSAQDGTLNESAQSVQAVATTHAASPTVIMGETNVLTNPESGAGNYLSAQSAVLSQSGTLQSMSFYVANAGGKLRLGVYDAAGPGGGPGAKKAETNEITPVVGWNTANVTTPVALAAGTYWLAFLPSDSNLSFAATSSGSLKYYACTYGALPATFSTAPESATLHCSLYATLTTGGGDTNAPIAPGGLTAR